MKKIVFEEGDEIRSLRGEIMDDDGIFITVRDPNGKEYKINKSKIVKIVSNNFISKEGS